MYNLLKVKLKVVPNLVSETLERIGIANRKDKIIFPSCYLHFIDDEPYILHFKQLFLLTRSDSYNNISEDDIIRRNSVVFCLKNWDLIEVGDDLIEPHNKFVFVLPFHEKNDWKIKHKFNIKYLADE